MKVKSLSHVRLFGTPWTVTCQAPPFMGFSRQEYWSGLPFPSPGDLPNPGIKAGSPTLQADALPSEPPGLPRHFMSGEFESSGIKICDFVVFSNLIRNKEKHVFLPGDIQVKSTNP